MFKENKIHLDVVWSVSGVFPSSNVISAGLVKTIGCGGDGLRPSDCILITIGAVLIGTTVCCGIVERIATSYSSRSFVDPDVRVDVKSKSCSNVGDAE
jgi:hypothetical protein